MCRTQWRPRIWSHRWNKKWGRIDVLINGAGPYHRVNLFDETIEGWNEMFDGNLHPIFYLAQAVAPGMKARKSGRIINFSMANADQMEAQPDVTAHYIAKAGVLILTRTLAKLLAPYGITVNAISPGFIDSGSAPPQELAAMTKRIPAGYIGTVDDTVAAVRLFAQRGGAVRQRGQYPDQRGVGNLGRGGLCDRSRNVKPIGDSFKPFSMNI